MSSEPWWARLLAALLDWWSGRQKQAGRDEILTEHQQAAEALREDYDEITSDNRSLDAAVGGLRSRAKARARGRDLPRPPGAT